MEKISAVMLVAFLLVVISMSSLVEPVRGVDLKTLRRYETVTVQPGHSGDGTHHGRRRRRSSWTLNESDDSHLEDAEFFFRGTSLLYLRVTERCPSCFSF